jgi:hypothetical protein
MSLMGRYKSVLMAARDAKEFPYHVDLPVPGNGLGKRMVAIADWLNAHFGSEWRSHGQLIAGVHTARYMFRTRRDADFFQDALVSGLLE